MMHFLSLTVLLFLLPAFSSASRADGRALRQATRADVIARYAQHRAAPSVTILPRASPSPMAAAAVAAVEVVPRAASPAECDELAVSAVDFSLVCAPEDILEPQAAADYLMSNGTVLQPNGTVRRDPLFDTAASSDPSSPLRSLVAAHSAVRVRGSHRRALPFFSRWTAKETRAGRDLLALSPNTAIRLTDLPEIALILLGRPQFEHVKIAGVSYDWRAMQALVDSITF